MVQYMFPPSSELVGLRRNQVGTSIPPNVVERFQLGRNFGDGLSERISDPPEA